MELLKYLKEFSLKKPIHNDLSEEMLDSAEVDTKVNIHTLYKHRWVWYHLILCIQMILTNILLVGILIILAVKL